MGAFWEEGVGIGDEFCAGAVGLADEALGDRGGIVAARKEAEAAVCDCCVFKCILFMNQYSA